MPSRFGPGFIPQAPDFGNLLSQALGEVERKQLLDEERKIRAEDRALAQEERERRNLLAEAELAQAGIRIGEPPEIQFQPRVAGMGVANVPPAQRVQPELAGAIQQERARGPSQPRDLHLKGEFVPEMLTFTPQMVERRLPTRGMRDPRYAALVEPRGERPGVYQDIRKTEPYLREERTRVFSRALEPRYGEQAPDVAAALALGREALPVSALGVPFEEELRRARITGEQKNELAAALAEERARIGQRYRTTRQPASQEQTTARQAARLMAQADNLQERNQIARAHGFQDEQHVGAVLAGYEGPAPPYAQAEVAGAGGGGIQATPEQIDARVDDLADQGLDEDQIIEIITSEFDAASLSAWEAEGR